MDSKILWTKDLESGVELVDQQHKKYFKMLNSFLTTLNQKEKVKAAFDFLRDYVKEHFSTEESLMVDYKYPAYKHHWQAHRFFKDKITLMAKDLEEDKKDTIEFDYLLVDWFINHIKTSDKKFCKFIKEELEKNNTLAYKLRSLLDDFLEK